MKLIGPFRQLLTLDNLPMRGALSDDQLEAIPNGAILVKNSVIEKVGNFEELNSQFSDIEIERIEGNKIALPAYIDSHTHLCFGGSRAYDFAMRNAGKTYLEIAENGGGIWSTVQKTRRETEEQLLSDLSKRIDTLIVQGIATIEIKSGYGLDKDNELKMLRIIEKAKKMTSATLVPTCLAAHSKPKDFEGNTEMYLNYILEEILPVVKEENLAKRVDIFIEKSAFHPEESRVFLSKTKDLGFQITVHADQFTPGSSRIAVELGAVSVDHLEAISDSDIGFLAKSETVATVLPGASLGLGEPFAPARKLLDAGAILAIATDWNPGSAPMGNLIAQASILATFQKLSMAEVLAGITFRAAKALRLNDRGILKPGMKADFVIYDTDHFQEILYHQGMLKPSKIYIGGNLIQKTESFLL